MKLKSVKEGLATVKVPYRAKVSKEMEVFYNPVMVVNRDLSTLVIKAFFDRTGSDKQELGKIRSDKTSNKIQVGLPLAGTGIRACRLLKEIPEMIKGIAINDYSPEAISLVKENLLLNGLSEEEIISGSVLDEGKVSLSNNEASKFLLSSMGFDYIDVDPFGSPNPFLDSAIKRISRGGILAVTATDTSALSGTYPNACRRKYWATPMRNSQMHEVGLRILIRKVLLLGVQYEKALTPVLSISKDHYMKVFFRCDKGKKECDRLLRKIGYFNHCEKCLRNYCLESQDRTCTCGAQLLSAGPLYTGPLHDHSLVEKMVALINRPDDPFSFISSRTKRLLNTVLSESEGESKGFCGIIRINDLARIYSLSLSKKELLSKGFFETHINPNAVKGSLEDLNLPNKKDSVSTRK